MRFSNLRAGLAAVFLGAALQGVAADVFPSRPITLVITQGPGSGSDVLGRLVANYLSPALGQPVVVDNRAGAGGIIGHQSVMGAAPDGYTLVFSSTAALFVVPIINSNARYTLADFVPVAPVMRAPFAVLVANTPGAPKTIAELTTQLRAKPQSFASSGVGSMTHLGSELLLRRAGVQATHIPYRGSVAAFNDLIGGQVLFTTDSLTASMSLIRSGKLRVLAVSGNGRAASLPDVPSLAEAGMPGLDIAVIGGLFAPKGTPREIVDKIAAATAKALQTPEVQQRFASLETDLLSVSTATFVDMLRQEAAVWEPLVRQLNIKVD